MELFTEYEHCKQDMHNAKMILETTEKKFNTIKARLESYIIDKAIYLNYNEMLKLQGKITVGNIVLKAEDGNITIKGNIFNNCTIGANGIIDKRYCNMYWKHITENKYQRIVGSYSIMNYEILGAYNLYLNGKEVYESKLVNLWKKLVK